jgi:methylmalonyl-CoA mutase C-terminal domain/subunit
MEKQKIRILIAKVGLDGHDRGAKYISQALRDRGYEVIYTGIRQTPEDVAKIAVQEDVQFVGLSLLSGAHNQLFPKVVEKLKELGAEDIVVFGGGVIPNDDIPFLLEHGIRSIFTPGTTTDQMEEFIQKSLEERAQPAR